MDIITGIQDWIYFQKQKGIKVNYLVFRMYPNIYIQFCDELRSRNCHASVGLGRVKIDGVQIGFDVMSWNKWDNDRRLKSLEHDTEFNNIIYKP